MLKASKHEAPLKIRSPQRAVKDDDVDRSQVHGRQRPQPSDTNHPNPFRKAQPCLSQPRLRHRDKIKTQKTSERRHATLQRVDKFRVSCTDNLSASDTASAMTPFHPIQVHEGEQTATASDKRTKAAIARGFHLFPFRTEKLNPAAPMVLRKWESR